MYKLHFDPNVLNTKLNQIKVFLRNWHAFSILFFLSFVQKKTLYHNMPNSVILAIFIHGLSITINNFNKILCLAFTFIYIFCFNCNVSYVLF